MLIALIKAFGVTRGNTARKAFFHTGFNQFYLRYAVLFFLFFCHLV